jgi:hypothetical protein
MECKASLENIRNFQVGAYEYWWTGSLPWEKRGEGVYWHSLTTTTIGISRLEYGGDNCPQVRV